MIPLALSLAIDYFMQNNHNINQAGELAFLRIVRIQLQ